MNFEHKIDIDAAREQVWAVLSDFPRAASLFPDVSDVAELDDGSYKGTMRVRIGPIGLNLAGTVDVEQEESQDLQQRRVAAA